MNYILAEKLKEKIEKKYLDAKEKARFAGETGTSSDCTKWDAIVLQYENVLRIIDSLQQEQSDFDDVDPKHLVHSHYTKVRETKTGRVFWAEYSSEAAEWYEAGTGKAYSISDVEIVKQQPEVDLENYISNKLRELGADLINHKPYSFNRGLNVGETNAYHDILDRLNARKEE